MKKIFEHTCMYEFLNERFECERALQPKLTMRKLALVAGFKSPSHFLMILKKQRKFSASNVPKICKALKLSAPEREYLENSIKLENEKAPSARSQLLSRNERIKHTIENKVQKINSDHGEVLADLANLNVYILAQNRGFQFDSDWIAKKTNLPAKKVERISKKLLDCGLWRIENGSVQVIAPNIASDMAAKEHWLFQFHENFIKHSLKVLKDIPGEERIFSGQTFLCNRKKLPLVLKQIDAFKRHLESEFEDLDSTDAFQLHISFVPLKGDSE